MRFLIHWGMRRQELCDPNLCHDSPGNGDRCPQCPLTRLDEAQSSPLGRILRRALNKRAILNIGIHLTLDDLDAAELHAILIIEDEMKKFDAEKRESGNG